MDEWRPIVAIEELEPSAPPRREGVSGVLIRLRDMIRWLGPGRVLTAFVMVPVIAVGAYLLLRTPPAPAETRIPYATTSAPSLDAPRTGPSADDIAITVHVAGHVHSPGVYELESGDRVVDAIRAAGGAQPIADLNTINLALVVNDGDQVYIPAIGEVGVSPTIGRVGNSTPNVSNSFPIDINTASAADLDRLPGIGPSTAEAIIGHREKFGAFTSPSALLEVPGIGPSKFEAIKDLVTT